MSGFKKGDIITCRDADDMIHTMQELAKAGVDTDFNYAKKKRVQIRGSICKRRK
jgi:hypothetical protein